MQKGKLTIGKLNSNDVKYNGSIHIRLEDDDYNSLFEVYIKPDKFAFAVTGLACQECEFESNNIASNMKWHLSKNREISTYEWVFLFFYNLL